MILFLDTSALVKLYAREPGSGDVRASVDRADGVACSWLAYVEARSAFAAKQRSGEIADEALRRCREEFEGDWARFHRVNVTQGVLRRAGELCERFALRACDSVHLAAAEWLQSGLGVPLTFGSFDRRQAEAALQMGLLSAYSSGDNGSRV